MFLCILLERKDGQRERRSENTPKSAPQTDLPIFGFLLILKLYVILTHQQFKEHSVHSDTNSGKIQALSQMLTVKMGLHKR